jgi:hypothetical protein
VNPQPKRRPYKHFPTSGLTLSENWHQFPPSGLSHSILTPSAYLWTKRNTLEGETQKWNESHILHVVNPSALWNTVSVPLPGTENCATVCHV